MAAVSPCSVSIIMASIDCFLRCISNLRLVDLRNTFTVPTTKRNKPSSAGGISENSRSSESHVMKSGSQPSIWFVWVRIMEALSLFLLLLEEVEYFCCPWTKPSYWDKSLEKRRPVIFENSSGGSGRSLSQVVKSTSQAALWQCQFLHSSFANQASLDMLETTLVALQDITLEKIFDDNGRKTLCSEFPQIMQQDYQICMSSMRRLISYERAVAWKELNEEETARCICFIFIRLSFI
ncbi:homeobox-leucine zipper protein ATHB-15-like [Pyrus ussuriensis x Pyrus communis]|uniref:Homeobox-leucine zipper protein ATHB-15-like n=1 Tax=Pyrus ussuriensis x Pyrus communis TaxID=2448454 RepID=A0A5N5GVI5_9ROSA|nr:homeobox-leucine zipper protein ATHB-15-like [Pyrus ussuriensis x Pyrus communis]